MDPIATARYGMLAAAQHIETPDEPGESARLEPAHPAEAAATPAAITPPD